MASLVICCYSPSDPDFASVPPAYDPRPGRYIRHIDFNHFRTIGMRRSVEEGMTSRFVTGERLESILKVNPGFSCTICRIKFTDYVHRKLLT
jgi:hypothetical protein